MILDRVASRLQSRGALAEAGAPADGAPQTLVSHISRRTLGRAGGDFPAWYIAVHHHRHPLSPLPPSRFWCDAPPGQRHRVAGGFPRATGQRHVSGRHENNRL